MDTKIKKVINTKSQSKWIEFKKDSKIETKSMFEVHKNEFGLPKIDKMELYKVQSDQLGYNASDINNNIIKVEGA